MDPDVIEAGNQAVTVGLSDAITAYEADHGQISADEMAAQARRDREEAVVVRGSRRTSKASGSE